MAVQIMSEVWAMGLGGSELLVALCLADRADSETRVCWPGVAYIAKRGGMSERTAQGAIRGLIEKGIIAREERPGTSSRYTFTPAESAPPQNLHPAESSTLPPQNLPPTPAESAPNTSLDIIDTSSPTEKATAVAETLDVGVPLKAANDENYATTVMRWAASNGRDVPHGQVGERYSWVLDILLVELPEGPKRRGLERQVILDYWHRLSEASGKPVPDGAYGWLGSLILNHGAHDVLRGLVAAGDGGAGLKPEHAKDPFAALKYAIAVVHDRNAA